MDIDGNEHGDNTHSDRGGVDAPYSDHAFPDDSNMFKDSDRDCIADKIEQACAIAHWKEWQNTEKGVDEYYKLNVLFDDTEEEEKVGWKKTMIRIPPSKRRAPPPRSRRRRSRDQGTSGGGGGGTTTREVDGNRKILPVKLPCDEKVLRGLSRKERAKTGCFGGGGGGGSGGGGGRRTSRSSRRGSGAGGSKTS